MTTRKIVVAILILLIAFGLLCASIYFIEQEQKQEVDSSIKEIAAPGDYIQYVYEGLKKGQKYIVFLNDDTASGKLSVMSCGNGAVNFENFDEKEEYFEIAVKTLVEYKSALSAEEKEKILFAARIEKGTISDTSSAQKVLISIGSEEKQSHASEVSIYFAENDRGEWIAMVGKE